MSLGIAIRWCGAVLTNYTRRVLACLPLLFFISALSAGAQKYLGSLTGQVADSTGAKIADATVTATDTTTNFSTKTVTNKSGSYSIQFLTPDTYNITVEHAGFRTQTSTGVVLTANGSVETDFTLSIGSSSESVTVSASQSLLDSTSADLGTTLTEKQVTDLPNIGRVPFFLASLTAGAYSNSYILSKSSGDAPAGNDGTAIIGNGVGSGRTLITLDGLLDNPSERISGSGGNTYGGFVPSPEAVQEVTVQHATYDAWSSGQTVINTVLRSGTNDYHGSFYYIFRNTYLNANTYERVPNQNGATNPKAPTPRVNGTWNQPGAVFDGPVRIPHLYNGRDKTYFMAAYERFSLRTYSSAGSTDLVPTAAEAGGDFSALCTGGFDANGVCVKGGGVQIYDPLSVAANGNRTPFPNNKIPSNRINPTGAALIKYFPAPNTNSSATVNYIAANPDYPQRYGSFVTRVDHSINENNKFYAVFYRSTLNQSWPNMGFPTSIGPTSSDELVYRNVDGGSFDYVSVLPHQWVLDARFGVIYHPFGVVYAGDPFDLSTLGMNSSGIAYQTFPGLSMSDSYAGLQAASSSQISTDTLGSAAVVLSKVIGRHNLSFGFEGSLNRYNGENPVSGLGTFAYNRQFTQENSNGQAGSFGVGGTCPAQSCVVGSDATSGNPIASLLLGYPSSGSYSNQVSFAIQQPNPAVFFQDNWRTTQKLVLDMDLRWDDAIPYTERYNRLNTGFCTTCTNPLQSSVTGLTLLGGLQFASSSNRRYYQNQLNHFQPRFGVSYALAPRVVLHAGTGLTYLNALESPVGQGFSASTSYIATTDNIHPATSLANPFPSGTVLPSGSSLGLATQIGQNLSFIAPNYVQPRQLYWTASTQTGLPANMVLQIAYVGNRVWDWENSKNINALPAQYNTGTSDNANYLNTKVPNPMAGQVPSNANLNGATIFRYYLLQPFPEFGTLTELYIPSGGSLYNALQVTLNKPMGHGLSVMGNFTWAHQMDTYQYKNPTDADPERFEDPQPNLLSNLAVIYQLPHFSRLSRYARWIIGGWQSNAVFRGYNGALLGNPANVTQLSDPKMNISSGSIVAGNPSGNHFNTCYENSAGVLQITGSIGSIAANVPGCRSSSSIPAFRQNNSYTLTSLGPYMKGIRYSAGTRLDASLFKTFPIHEKATFEIRGEFFNVLNRPVFGAPNVVPGGTTYGAITLTQANDARIGQLTARFNF